MGHLHTPLCYGKGDPDPGYPVPVCGEKEMTRAEMAEESRQRFREVIQRLPADYAASEIETEAVWKKIADWEALGWDWTTFLVAALVTDRDKLAADLAAAKAEIEEAGRSALAAFHREKALAADLAAARERIAALEGALRKIVALKPSEEPDLESAHGGGNHGDIEEAAADGAFWHVGLIAEAALAPAGRDGEVANG